MSFGTTPLTVPAIRCWQRAGHRGSRQPGPRPQEFLARHPAPVMAAPDGSPAEHTVARGCPEPVMASRIRWPADLSCDAGSGQMTVLKMSAAFPATGAPRNGLAERAEARQGLR